MARTDTRDRLLTAAKELLHQQGLHRTSLADIAEAAGVPLGNVYYHFRTKESLVGAVIDGYADELCGRFVGWELLEDPRARLSQFISTARDMTEVFARYGCPYGTLCFELERDEDALGKAATNLIKLQVDWAAQQFEALGAGAQARDLAVDLVAGLQGSYMMTNAFHSADLLKGRLERLDVWIDAAVVQMTATHKEVARR